MKLSRVLVLAVLLFAFGAAYRYYPPLRLSLLVLTGRSPVCPYAQAVRAADNLRLQIAIKDRILYASKKLETDAQGYRLWETPKGRYWIP